MADAANVHLGAGQVTAVSRPMSEGRFTRIDSRRRILVTGARGFIGRHLIPLLVDPFEVHAVTSSMLPSYPGVTWHRANLLNRDELLTVVTEVRPTHLLHLAWYTEQGIYWNSPVNLDWTAASLNLLKAFHEVGGRRFVGVGTCAEYSLTGDGPAVEGSTPEGPSSLYGACKLAVARIAQEFAKGAGMQAAWARLFYLFGPGETPNRFVPSIVVPLLRGEPVVCRNPGLVRDYLYVGEAAAALHALLDSEVTGVVNVASGAPISLGDLTALIAERAGATRSIQAGGGSDSAEIPVIAADVTRLSTEVGWHPSRALADAIDQTLAWWSAPDRMR
jgi:nucleoside-diphosphate-sugar epimerase